MEPNLRDAPPVIQLARIREEHRPRRVSSDPIKNELLQESHINIMHFFFTAWSQIVAPTFRTSVGLLLIFLCVWLKI